MTRFRLSRYDERQCDYEQWKSVSDLSIEERLAAGASVDDLVAAGVLHDDYDPENDPDYFFTPLRPVEEFTPGPPMPDEEFEALLKRASAFSDLARERKAGFARLRARGLEVDSPEYIAFKEESNGKAAQLRAEILTRNASNTAV
jgi:hypothetical protein